VICLRLAALALVIAIVGCSRDRAGIREWRASDHDQEGEPASNAQGPARSEISQSGSGNPAATSLGNAASPRESWEALCAGCHGHLGSDGRLGVPATGVRDLTDPKWQQSTSDGDIARTIVTGRGRMPSFSLRKEEVADLTALIRRLRPRN
jgi:mono/diheme cytochrome c family protein